MKAGKRAVVKSMASPDNPFCHRLEAVRRALGYPSVRSFWLDLTEGPSQVASYAAAKNYHKDREPPPSYLADVCRVFDVNPAYLLLGEGQP